MASWALYRVGFWIRETGQALDRVGCFLQGNASYAEEGAKTTFFDLAALQPASLTLSRGRCMMPRSLPASHAVQPIQAAT